MKVPCCGKALGVSTSNPNHDVGRTPEECDFVAVDFEIANPTRDSACAIGLVRVEHGQIVARERRLIRPPTPWFTYTPIHGIDWEHVASAPPFADVWSDVEPLVAGATFLAAHNASFDRSVLDACCRRASIHPPLLPMRCSMQIARRVWGIHPTTLPDVCRFLRIPLQHHDALSDAEACARIVLAVGQTSEGTIR
jgi:DNA polymerase-3 subunit epsilon